MRAVVVRCPECNANLRVEHTVTSVTCSYCNTTSRIQPRTKVFQIPVHIATPSTTPIARQRFSWLRWLPLLLVIAIGLGGGIFAATLAKRGGFGSMMLWMGGTPIRLDVDGDGTGDLIGIVMYPMDNSRAHLAAFSGKTGDRLWESESLGPYSELGNPVLGATNELVLLATPRGELIARDRRGQVKWKTTLDERITALCGRPAASDLAVVTADNKWYRVDHAGKTSPSGALSDSERAETCQPPSGSSFASDHDIRIEGMSIGRVVRRDGEPIVAIGAKSPGTRIPMIARIESTRATWTATVPAVDPLVATLDDKMVATSERMVFAMYQPGSPARPRLTGFDVATGKRLWDSEIAPGKNFSPANLTIGDGDVFLATWSELLVFDQRDGRLRFRIGRY